MKHREGTLRWTTKGGEEHIIEPGSNGIPLLYLVHSSFGLMESGNRSMRIANNAISREQH